MAVLDGNAVSGEDHSDRQWSKSMLHNLHYCANKERFDAFFVKIVYLLVYIFKNGKRRWYLLISFKNKKRPYRKYTYGVLVFYVFIIPTCIKKSSPTYLPIYYK